MKYLVSFPGRAGDIFWMLPTARAISEFHQTPIDLCIGGEFAGLVPLLSQQSYLGKVWADPHWGLTPPNEWQHPLYNEEGYDQVWALGYRRWPELPLPYETFERVASGWLPALDLTRPWITAEPVHGHGAIACGWSDCWFELKYGLTELLAQHYPLEILPPLGSRWVTEGHHSPASWGRAAQVIAGMTLFFGDCSALHVLAVALGKPVVLCEPMEARHNPIFYPLGKTGPQVTLVTGNDGLPTFDARHVADALQEALAHA